ncbi:VOC family protein [Henriciella mobilis]|uniref:Glyoxalase n=1 Tax=Henriciella mobilis TaxID=2305467 RepID=A0A399RFQ4_9PROT|nr:VOC family protein [Henriciella mobilis]RIJ30406.1 glyoxalase [Henriciella mobilis]
MIDALDHIVLVCPEIEAGAAVYSSLLGREPSWRAKADGAATALFSVQNTALELMAPDGTGPVADRLREIIAERGPGLTSLAFRTGDIAETHHKLARRGLIPGDITDGESTNLGDSSVRRWKRFRCSDEAMAGIKTFILQPESAPKVAGPASGAVQSLDHIVINTPNPDRALGLYGAKLGLDLRLDRTAEQWKTRFLFFRTGGLTFEVIHRLGEAHDPAGPDTIWGLTWAVDDLAAAHARLSETGLDISDIRTGRKPGTSVFTVRNGTLGVPTLFISHSPR